MKARAFFLFLHCCIPIAQWYMAHNRCSTNICERKKRRKEDMKERERGKKGMEGKRKGERLKRREVRMVEKKEVQYLFSETKQNKKT